MWLVAGIFGTLLLLVAGLAVFGRKRSHSGEPSRWNRLTDLYKNTIMR